MAYAYLCFVFGTSTSQKYMYEYPKQQGSIKKQL